MVDFAKRNLFKGSTSPSPNKPTLPWLKDPDTFFEKCTRCSKCTEHCETHVIKHSSGGFPSIDFSEGECTFCYQCAEVCPESLFINQDSSPWDNKANISDACLADKNVECRSCADACEPMAIQFQLRIGQAAKPAIDSDKCNGCGACVAICPTSAINVTVSDMDETEYGT
ncbi:ferredoxin-type protein NapF [Vibrio marisflavi]|uniref:Ferredoxin-type protein NapF n=1 Tax=Vibrio marisflavi CECT 7928 TaxID=634439 RepID=A0ABM9A0C2_9VIBR|nr:ferredoxin-type protein NapF [Vibrio marisflavi]CAH0536884.1 Ferredoxin-type protein NapF [Vibrio marisflavi CECT 7928]